MRKATLKKIREHALRDYPEEACGLLVNVAGKEKYWPCRNASPEPGETFVLDPQDYAAAEDAGDILMIVHSHPDGSAEPSEGDRVGIEASRLPWLIISVYKDLVTDEMNAETFTITEPSGYQAPLIGRRWSPPHLDCYALIRDYYQRELGILLPDYDLTKRAGAWWTDDGATSLYAQHYADAGFVRVDDGPIKHDVIVMDIASSVGGNHAGIYLGDETGHMLHHLYDRPSARVPYGGYWLDNTTMVLRYKGKQNA